MGYAEELANDKQTDVEILRGDDFAGDLDGFRS